MENTKHRPLHKTISIEYEIGSKSEAARSRESLKPVEIELRRIESLSENVVASMMYLKKREEEMRDTSELTNSRVQNFNVLTIILFVAAGTGQVVYLKRFFKSKKLL